MAIPDALWGAGLTLGAGFAWWAFRAAVKEQIPSPSPIPPPAPAPPFPMLQSPATSCARCPVPVQDRDFLQLSARDWLNLSTAFEKQFNGRYLRAEEFRDTMNDVRRDAKEGRDHADLVAEKLHERISKLGRTLDEKFTKLSDELNGKADKP